MHSQQALIRVSFIQTTVFIEKGLSSGEAGARAAGNCGFRTCMSRKLEPRPLCQIRHEFFKGADATTKDK